MLVENFGFISQGLHSHASNADNVGGLQYAQRSIAQQCSSKTLPVQTTVNSQATQYDHGNGVGHIAAQAASGLVAHHSAGSDCVIGHDLIVLAYHVRA